MSAAPSCTNVISPMNTSCYGSEEGHSSDSRRSRSSRAYGHPEVDYVVRAQWGDKYVVDVTVSVHCANHPNLANRFGVNGWTFEFALNPDHEITKIWNGKLHQDGLKCTVQHQKFCSPINGRAIFYFGFEARAKEGRCPSFPSSVVVNGKVCEVHACYARELADCAFDYVAESRSPSPSPPASREASPEPRTPPRRCKSAPAIVQLYPFAYKRSRYASRSEPWPEADCRCVASSEAASEASTPIDESNNDHAQDIHEDTQRDESDYPRPDAGTPNRDQETSCLTPCVPQINEIYDSESSTIAASSVCGKRKASELDSPVPSVDSVCPAKRVDAQNGESPVAAVAVAASGATRTLAVEYYRRSEQVKKRKFRHMDWIDASYKSREQLVLATVLNEAPIVLEPNMFPYDTPAGVSHWTLWSKSWLKDEEVEDFVGSWLKENMPEAVEWNFDDNMSDGLSINLFHVHVYIRCSA